ncbi:MAG: aminopeptidase [Candidatus Diapherotrites archaeon]|nr:aminopeptidase [Candidatus Diapherotrites archaeon]
MASFGNPNFSGRAGRRFSVKARKRVAKVSRIPYKKPRIIVQPYMRPAARNFTNSMLLKPDERVAIFPDRGARAFAEALSEKIRSIGCKAQIIELTPQHDWLRGEYLSTITNALRSSEASVYLGSAGTLETERVGDYLVKKIQEEKLTRHISLGELSPELIKRVLAVRPERMRRLTQVVYESVKNCRTMKIASAAGTNLTIEFNPQYARWFPDADVVKEGSYTNNPAGEVFTAPFNANGRVVFNGVIDLFNSVNAGKSPMSIEIRNGHAVLESVKCADRRIYAEFMKKMHEKNATRIGEFSLPTNVFLPELKIPSTLVDEKRIIAIAFGDPLQHDTHANYSSKTHIDMTIPNANVYADNRPLIVNGNYVPEILGKWGKVSDREALTFLQEWQKRNL